MQLAKRTFQSPERVHDRSKHAKSLGFLSIARCVIMMSMSNVSVSTASEIKYSKLRF